ncbi:hypothetical protein B0T10DRAFT_490336 [Thelonectria olida]|uniref:BZIP domain-containing protein n=1 Tax=Thelonectria olida TaxID=1576542 RepID=A0A9P8W3Z4_9HYPO|nr:hypothetical protein B0T10DRAFT_490336 [Thelonectria olida]
MPRKNRTPASLDLSRENQRRCRARRRELIDDLQRRVLEYERRDAQATLEMQQVARAVAAENVALRDLLAAKNVTRDEVDAHLASNNGRITQDATLQPRSRLPSRRLSPKQTVVVSPSTVALSGQSPGMALTGLAARSALSTQPAAASTNRDGQNCSHSPLQESRHDREEDMTCACVGEPDDDGNSFNMPSIDPACYCPPDPPQTLGRQLTSNGMPCLEAALILARLGGHPDSTLVHAKLGCAEGTDCVVRNTDVLRLMDEMT